jgi:hypothetical protein
LTKVEGEYFPVHVWLDCHQYAYYCHERGLPSVCT